MPQFKMELQLLAAIEQYVTVYCVEEIKRRHPKCQCPHHTNIDDCDAKFETMFQQIMDNIMVTLKAPQAASVMLPVTNQTVLRLEATYGK